MNDNPLESFSLEPAPNDRKLVMLVYILQGLGLVTGGLTWVVGAMVNYLYDLGRITENHEAFATSQKVTASAALRILARKALTTAA